MSSASRILTHARSALIPVLQKTQRTNFSSTNKCNSTNYQLVIIGTGWAGYKLFHECRANRYNIEQTVQRPVDIVLVSKRNHFLYTPLLASTTVGTLEFRSIVEPIRDNRLRHEKDFQLASVVNIDPTQKEIELHSELLEKLYSIQYDTLVIACGSKPTTFNIPGVTENAFFLKELHHAREIRSRINANMERSTQAMISEEERHRLLHFVIVGGGPTGVEFCAELYDFLVQDLKRLYPRSSKYLSITIIDANEILTGFDTHLRDFAMQKLLERPMLRFVKENCMQVEPEAVVLKSGRRLPCGLVVWTAGVGPNDLTQSLTICEKSPRGHILTNAYCQVLGVPEVEKTSSFRLPLQSNIFAIGDCAEIQNVPIPATAQKAETQAVYVSQVLRQVLPIEQGLVTSYRFHNKGMLAYLGSDEGLFELKSEKNNDESIAKLKGWKAWIIWRSAYLTKLGSWRLRLQVPIDWFKAWLVGRDITRF